MVYVKGGELDGTHMDFGGAGANQLRNLRTCEPWHLRTFEPSNL